MKSQEETKAILVPVDFTAITPNAINHAIELAKLFNKPIQLLHIVSKGMFESESKVEIEEEEALAKLSNLAEEIFERSGIEVFSMVRRGNIYDTIGEIAKELPATIAVMGTHGVKGIQKIVGSNAIRVIYSAGDVPFFVVQQRPVPDGGYKKVVLPFSFTVESRQKLAWAIHLNKIFKCKFHLLIESENDEFIAQKLKNNQVFAEKYLRQHDCDYEISYAPVNTPFYKDIIHHSVSINADLILLMTKEESNWTEYFSGPEEQNVIANPAQIPVFCINPVDNMQILGSAMFQ
jgi:nucleotide-binding universal stress UspA family protein